MHWITNYLGMKYEVGGRGPDRIDCWGLLYLVYRDRFGIELPEFPGVVDSSAENLKLVIRSAIATDWKEIYNPFDGAAVQMGTHHVGIYASADGGKVIHCWERQGVAADTLRGLALKGFTSIRYFQHRLWLTS